MICGYWTPSARLSDPIPGDTGAEKNKQVIALYDVGTNVMKSRIIWQYVAPNIMTYRSL